MVPDSQSPERTQHPQHAPPAFQFPAGDAGRLQAGRLIGHVAAQNRVSSCCHALADQSLPSPCRCARGGRLLGISLFRGQTVGQHRGGCRADHHQPGAGRDMEVAAGAPAAVIPIHHVNSPHNARAGEAGRSRPSRAGTRCPCIPWPCFLRPTVGRDRSQQQVSDARNRFGDQSRARLEPLHSPLHRLVGGLAQTVTAAGSWRPTFSEKGSSVSVLAK